METHLAVTGKTNLPSPKPSLRPLYSPDEMIAFHKDVTDLITKALVKGQDYGAVPGISKPFLFKPGAERLCKAFGCSAHYEIVSSEVNYDIENKVKTKFGENTAKGRFSYTIRCSLKSNENRIIGDGIGLASTTEKKYAYAPCDNNNTALKMAQKRSLVAAVLNAFGLSDRFTQDEDIAEDPTVPRPIAAPTEKKKIIFDEKNDAHINKLEKVLLEKAIPARDHILIAEKLHGKEFNKVNVDQIIEDVKSIPIEIPF